MDLIFGGTSEGRELYASCREAGLPVMLSVATEYGRELAEQSPEDGFVHAGRMDEPAMEKFFREKGIARVVDATHPFAVEVSRNIKAACEACSLPYIRYRREGGTYSGGWTCRDTAEAVRILETVPGNILLTTGSKELAAVSHVPGFSERFYARVLPSEESMRLCREAGLPGSHILGMQGPFSEEWNRLSIREWNIQVLVTKDSGKRGGFEEKLSAAQKEGIRALIIGRPPEEENALDSLESVLQYLSAQPGTEESK